MATTIAQSFAKLRSNLEITDLQQETVSTRQTSIREVLAAELTLLDSFLTGSYSRSTMISPLSEADVDVFIVLDASYFERDGQVALLDRVKRVLRGTYTKTPDISRNGQAVTITFTDFVVDVVPAFHRNGGGFLIPSTHAGGYWLQTDPKKHVEISAASNKAHQGDLVPLVKMIKCWNRTIDKHFRSFHLEALIWRILDNVKISSFSSAVRYVFDKARELIRTKLPDPAGYSDDVGFYLDTSQKLTDAVSRFEIAYRRAAKAEEYERDEQVALSIGEWRKIFGDSFPAYG